MDVRAIGGEEDSAAGDGEENQDQAFVGQVVGFSFIPSADYKEHINRRYINERSYGATAGDSFWLGLGSADLVDPFARYREDDRKPIECPGWRAMIDKAKADIRRHKSEQRVQLLAESLSEESLLKDIEAIRVWANSLRKINHQFRRGWTASTQHATN
nr:MAG TPA: hypothetical protein [Caudoviricetes sp.]